MIKSEFNVSAFVPFANLIFDTTDLYRIINEITTLERSLFKDKVATISQRSKDFLASNLTSIFVELETAGLEPSGDVKQQQFLKDLVYYLKVLPQIKLTLAFSPTRTFIHKLNKDFSDITNQKVVLDILVNEEIIGGAIFEYGGKVFEYTMVERLDVTVTNLVKNRIVNNKNL